MTGHVGYILCFFVISIIVSVVQLFHATTFDLSSPSWSFESDAAPSDSTATNHFIKAITPEILSSPSPPRILLGIFGTIDNDDDAFLDSQRKLIEIHRSTHLQFDSVHHTSTPNRVCSIQKFSARPVDEWNPYECQLVYAFVFGANQTRDATPPSEWAALLSSASSNNNQTTTKITPTHETLEQMGVSEHSNRVGDFLFLNTGDRHLSYKIWSWHQYVANEWTNHKGVFDYIAHTDTKVRMYPVEFWQNPIFASPQTGVFAGFVVPQSKCAQSKKSVSTEWCPSLQAPAMAQRFSVLSTDLLEATTRANPEETYGPLKSSSKESMDVPLANILQGLPEPIVCQSLNGVKPLLTNRGSWSEYLHEWDKYKDAKLLGEGGYKDPKEAALAEASNATKYFSKKGDEEKNNHYFSGPRVLLGIFSMDSPTETERREAVRSTYLSYYKDSPTPNRICSLQELLSGSLPNNGDECQMVFTFVMGSNPNGPTELTEPNATFPMTVVLGENQNPMSTSLKDEKDVVHLNIRENMEDGKSPTWFRYATTVIDNHYYFDYVGKTDTDTLIFPNYLLDTTLAKYPTFPDNIRVYAGQYRLKYEWTHRKVGPIYMGGHLYWMSADLARFVSSPELDRRAVDWGIEDFSMGNFVHSHPRPIRRTPITGNKAHKHPLKLVEAFRDEWASFLKEKKQKSSTATQ